MKNINTIYKNLLFIKNLKGLSCEKALNCIGGLIDVSLDLRRSKGLKRALELSKTLRKRKLTPEQSCTLHYFQANAWANLKELTRKNTDEEWEWEQMEIEKEIFHYRSALLCEGFEKQIKIRKCQILTNLANTLSHIGRPIEAIEYWDRALEIDPDFAIARGNKGVSLKYYSQYLYDNGHQVVFLKQSFKDLKKALDFSSTLEQRVQESYKNTIREIKSILSPKILSKKNELEDFSLGQSEHEIKYRKWCLENRLFLNPLNDLGSYPIAAGDVLTTPSMILNLGVGPYYQGFYNQMKQEFVSSRYLYYEGMNSDEPHFSDERVLLYNTLDYPAYSLAVEKVKSAYRTTYSILDKIAYFLQDYFKFEEEKIYFSTLWYKFQRKSKGLRKCFKRRKNIPLRGLFWLSKDLFEDKPGFMDLMEPDSKQLREIRNYLEHRYLKLHLSDWGSVNKNQEGVRTGLKDTLSYSLSRKDFEEKTLRLIKLVRAALIYLSLSIHFEEKRKKKEMKPGSIAPPIVLGIWKDEWKR